MKTEENKSKTRNGRPRLSKELQRCYPFQFKMTKIERDKFDELFIQFTQKNNLSEKNFSRTDFIKSKIFRSEELKIREYILSDITFQINKIGNNVNQIAKKINSISNPGYNHRKEIDDVYNLILKIYQILEKL